MTGTHTWSAQLAAMGFSPGDGATRRELVAQAVDGFRQSHGGEPRWGWIVPGRIEVFGKHTDYAGGRSLVAAVPRGFAIVAAPRPDCVVSALDARWQVAMDLDLADDARTFRGWANYVAVMARRLAQNFPGAALGANIAFASDLPRAAGLSSSSALVVGVALALIRCAGLEARPEWQQAIRSPLDLAGYLGAAENGLTFGRLAGTSGVGTHGGSEDHTAILTSRAGHVSAYAYVPVRRLGDCPVPDDWRFVVMASGIEADKAGSAMLRYNRASLATRALAEVWRTRCGGPDVTLASLLGITGAEAALRTALGSGGAGDFSSAELRRRLDHFVAEDGRVPAALDGFARADADAIGRLSDASQHDAAELLDNQIPETVALARLARESGAFAASSFGAGFGGSVWALVPSADADAFAQRWHARYAAAWPALRVQPGFVVRPGPSAMELAVSES